jgi:hypothetical protein
MRGSFVRRDRYAVLVVITAGLLAAGADCHRKKAAQVTLILEDTGGRCHKTAVTQPATAPDHGDTIEFAIDNRCSSTQWVGLSWTGKSSGVLSCSARFPMLQWFEYPSGVSSAGSCVKSTLGEHCHKMLVMVRSGAVRPSPIPLPSPNPVCPGIFQDHSLDFQDVPP